MQCITHHSESVFNFSTGCETWCDETGAERLPAAETQRDFLWSWRLLMEGAIQVYASDALNLSCAVKKKNYCIDLQSQMQFTTVKVHFQQIQQRTFFRHELKWIQ